jgi:outer membrane protein
VALKYYFALEQRLRPYAGAGMAITAFYDVTPAGLDHAVVGPAAEAGLDVRLDPHWMLNADVSWAQVRSGDIRVDPVRFGLGVVHRF